jgi:hypothetical protein
MRGTLYICTKVINAIDYCRESVKSSEKDIKDNLAQRYFDEIYSLRDEYIEKQFEEAQARYEYYAEHPEEIAREFEEWEKEPEGYLIEDFSKKKIWFNWLKHTTPIPSKKTVKLPNSLNTTRPGK